MKARIQNPRWLWMLALVLGVACAAAFGVAMLTPPDRASPTPSTMRASGSNRGFGVGVVLGLGAGIAIGFAIARGTSRSDAASTDQSVDAAHSSRKSP